MGSEFFRQPAKRLDREFRSMGGARHHRTAVGVYYQFPDGGMHLVPTAVTAAKARSLLDTVTARYGVTRARESGNPLRSAVEREGAPTINADDLVMSRHASTRFELMSAQARLDRIEVADALRFPEKVLWSPLNESWLWVRGRVIVAAVLTDDQKTLITTLLWGTEELWKQNPRPKQDDQ